VLHELDGEATEGALVVADAQALDDGAGLQAQGLGAGDDVRGQSGAGGHGALPPSGRVQFLGTVCSSRWITSSPVTPSLWAVKCTIRRWRRIGRVTAATSSALTWCRPSSTAWALAARIRFMLARGPAPQVR